MLGWGAGAARAAPMHYRAAGSACALDRVCLGSTQEVHVVPSIRPRHWFSHTAARSLAAGAAIAALAAAPASGAQPATQLLSVTTTGVSADDAGTFGRPQWSAGGLVVFSSASPKLVPGDTNGRRDVFVRDLSAGTTTLVSVGMNGQPANNDSDGASISADGRFVAFGSLASNLVPGDTNSFSDVFVRDLQSGTTTRISIPLGGGQANGHSAFGSAAMISANGRYVAFSSTAQNLVPGKPTFTRDVYVYDRQTGAVERASVPQAGGWANGPSDAPSVSNDGVVVFQSAASNLVVGDGNGAQDVFLRDTGAGTTALVSHTAAGAPGDGASSVGVPGVTPDGRVVAFSSSASNLVPGDTNLAPDAFLYDRSTDAFTLVSTGLGGAPARGTSSDPTVSADGRRVAFASFAPNLVADDNDGATDVFVRDLASGITLRASVAMDGGDPNGASQLPAISPDGSDVAFASKASDLVAGDGGGWDAFASTPAFDADAPVVSCGAPDGAWHAADAAVACTASDAGVGLAEPADAAFTLTTSVAQGTETADAVTGSRTVCDAAGNCATAGPIAGNRVDKRAPDVACGAADGAWHAANVTIACTAADAGSGLASAADAAFGLATEIADGQETASAATGSRVVCDAVGNCAEAGPVGGNEVDRRAPSIDVSAPADGATYPQGAAVTASYSCGDGGSGVASCVGPKGGLDTTTPGRHEVTVTATDRAGNGASRSVGYNVGFAWRGFFTPPLSHAHAGRTIPLAFSLGGDYGLGVLAEGSPRSVAVSCDTGAPLGAGEPAEAVAGGLVDLPWLGRYLYLWKTSPAWAGMCRRLAMTLADGSVHTLDVSFDADNSCGWPTWHGARPRVK